MIRQLEIINCRATYQFTNGDSFTNFNWKHFVGDIERGKIKMSSWTLCSWNNLAQSFCKIIYL